MIDIVLLSVGLVLKDNARHHFVEPIGDAVAVLLPDLLGSEVCGDECKELLVVPILQQVGDRIEDVSEIQHLSRFPSDIFHPQHEGAFDLGETGIILGLFRNFACIDDSDTHTGIFILVFFKHPLAT